jgi:hypothetical protein
MLPTGSRRTVASYDERWGRGELSHGVRDGRPRHLAAVDWSSMRSSTLIAAMCILVGSLWGLSCGDNTDGTPDGGSGGGGTGGGDRDASSGGDTGSTACPVDPPVTCPTPVRFAQVQPIFSQRCMTCHDGVTINQTDPEKAPIWALSDYGHIKDWESSIRGELSGCTMPPADAGSKLTVEERLAILQWIKCGAVN